jgi:alpha-beta hydrolase superfamily lysophospholipase
MTNLSIARRMLFTQTASGLGALFGAGFGFGLAPAVAQTVSQSPMTGEIRKNEFSANKGDVKLALYRKRLAKPDADKSPPVLFLVHGSSLSALSSFDLNVPGDQYSMMDVFAGYGFDVWTVDHEGFGQSSQTAGTSDIASRVEDLKAALATVQRETGRSKVHMFGESSGSIAAAAFAQNQPGRVDRLVLAASTYRGEGAAEIQRRPRPHR